MGAAGLAGASPLALGVGRRRTLAAVVAAAVAFGALLALILWWRCP